MAKRSLAAQLDDAVEAILTGSGEMPPAPSSLAALVRIASDLSDLPSEDFKARLKTELERKARMMKAVRPIPEGYHAVTPYLTISGAARAIEFYKRAFGATEILRMPDPSGRIAHAELMIGDSPIMLADEFPERGNQSPQSLRGSSVTIHLYVEDVDALARRAVAAGASVLVPVTDQFYGNRSGRFADPFGHVWILATRKEDVSGEEMTERYAKLVAAAAEKPAAPRPVQPIPTGFHSVTPTFIVKEAAKLADFLVSAFGAEKIQDEGHHLAIRIGDSMIETGAPRGDLKESTGAFHLYVEDADAVYERALRAGAASTYPPMDMFYGDREAGVKDPLGNHWFIATHKEDLSSEEVAKRAEVFFKEHPDLASGGSEPGAAKPFREGFHTVTPYLVVRDAPELVEFVKKAFAAEEVSRTTGSAGGLHIEVKIGDSMVMIGGGGTPRLASLYLYVKDVDSLYARALQAGATSLWAPLDQPYGDRNAGVADAFGNQWYIATPKK